MDDFEAASDAEIERRRHVRTALADSRIEGCPPPEDWELEIWQAYIRGEIDPKDLVDVIKEKLFLVRPAPEAS